MIYRKYEDIPEGIDKHLNEYGIRLTESTTRPRRRRVNESNFNPVRSEESKCRGKRSRKPMTEGLESKLGGWLKYYDFVDSDEEIYKKAYSEYCTKEEYDDPDSWKDLGCYHMGDLIQNGYENRIGGVLIAKPQYIDKLSDSMNDLLFVDEKGMVCYPAARRLYSSTLDEITAELNENVKSKVCKRCRKVKPVAEKLGEASEPRRTFTLNIPDELLKGDIKESKCRGKRCRKPEAVIEEAKSRRFTLNIPDKLVKNEAVDKCADANCNKTATRFKGRTKKSDK